MLANKFKGVLANLGEQAKHIVTARRLDILHRNIVAMKVRSKALVVVP